MGNKRVIALIGNPNCGKTTLFNKLTKSHQKVGNRTGVTVELKEGAYYKDKSVMIEDLPGTYSLDAYSNEEAVVENYLNNTPPNVIINVVDGTNLTRNLLLTCKLAALNIPVVIAVNMYDDLIKNNVKLNVAKLSRLFNLPVITVSALKDTNFDKLINTALHCRNAPKLLNNIDVNDTDACYNYLKENLSEVITEFETKRQRISNKIDDVLTGRFTGIFIFSVVSFLVCFLSIKAGKAFSNIILSAFSFIGNSLNNFLNSVNASRFIIGLTVNAIIGGIGAVLSFLPQILLLFIFTTFLESSGYMSRVAFILDRLLKKLGLSGKAIIPLILGCGCIVPAATSAKTIENERERKLTLYLLGFMPCGAKLEVFIGLSIILFNGSAVIATSAYFASIITIIISALILKKFKSFSQGCGSFILELPPYRLPDFKELGRLILLKIKEFIVRAGTLIFITSVIFWFLQSFSFKGYVGDDYTKSILYLSGNVLKYVFYPLGFGNSYEAAVSIISGVMAKEQIYVTLLTLTGGNLQSVFTNGFTAYAFMLFCLLACPCAAALISIKKELGSKKELLKLIAFEFTVGYVAAFLVNLFGILIRVNKGLTVTAVILIVISLLLIFAIKNIKTKKCFSCVNCKHCKRIKK